MNEEGELEFEGDPDDALLEEVEEAIDVCPVQAIFLED